MTADFLYTAGFAVAEDMDDEFLSSVHTLVDHLLGAAADDVELAGHRLTIDKALATLAITFAITVESFDRARELGRPLAEGAVSHRAAPLDRWTFTLRSEEILDLAVDRSSPAWRIPATADGFTADDRPDDGLVWELIDGVLCSKPLKTEAEARVISNLARLLGGDEPR